ncbi:hypothetical protein VNO77_09288 [Canavalia gladiata]|uniref:Uncharacterized protein n=1 Tax=Canavalia gladiata TaxID=3824 RepID=A0AAN9MEL9_CANGL
MREDEGPRGNCHRGFGVSDNTKGFGFRERRETIWACAMATLNLGFGDDSCKGEKINLIIFCIGNWDHDYFDKDKGMSMLIRRHDYRSLSSSKRKTNG